MNNSFCYTNKNQNNKNENQIFKRILEECRKEINNMNECLKFNEENYEEELKIIRNRMTDYLNENIILKNKNDKLLLENNYKDMEIEKYKLIIRDYQKLLLNNKEKEYYIKNNLEKIIIMKYYLNQN